MLQESTSKILNLSILAERAARARILLLIEFFSNFSSLDGGIVLQVCNSAGLAGIRIGGRSA
jgi:hypothetical protein